MSTNNKSTTAKSSKTRPRDADAAAADQEEDEHIVEAVGVSAAEIIASKPKKSKKKSTATPAEEKVKTHDASAVKARSEQLPQVAAKNAAFFKSMYNRDYAAKLEYLSRPFPEGIVCVSCDHPITDEDPAKVMVFSEFYGDEAKRVYIHKHCAICHAVVNPTDGKFCGTTSITTLASSSNSSLPARIQFDRHGHPVCANHADDHALDVPTFSESDADGMVTFINKFGFVKVRPDGERALTAEQCQTEHDRVLHGFAVSQGIPFPEFKNRVSQQGNWAASYLKVKIFVCAAATHIRVCLCSGEYLLIVF